jgi:gamma-butyrobetaine dioxygenase
MGVSAVPDVRVDVDSGGTVELRADGAPARRLIPFWLRENCPCPECAHPGGGQRIVDITELPDDVRPAAVAVDDGALAVEWSDGHRSRYPLAGLLALDVDDDLPPAELWDAATVLPGPFAADVLGSDSAQLRACLESVHRFGLALVNGAPARPGALEDVVALFGHVRETNYGRLFDVRMEIDPANLAYTGRALGPHTDNPYRDPTPGLQLLHCIRAAGAGGETTLVDGFAVAELLERVDPDGYRLLAETEIGFRYHAPGVDLRSRFPVLRLDSGGGLAEVRWNTRSCRPFGFEPGLAAAYYRAYRGFGRLTTDPLLVRRMTLRPGHVVVMDNLRVLHGRTEISAPGDRHLQGCYADRDGLRSRLRTLRRAEHEEGHA